MERSNKAQMNLYSLFLKAAHLSLLLLSLCVLVPAASQAQSGGMCPTGVNPQIDLDGDCVDDNLERGGYTSTLESCTPAITTTACFVTDPTAWSSDGDPYSDFQEATGVNMDNTITPPFDGPLVAAAPKIEIDLVRYRFDPTGDITDSSGRTISRSQEQEFSLSTTASVSYTVGSEAMAGTTGGSVTASSELTTSLSVTAGYSSTQTQGQSMNWETATTTNVAHAADLKLDIRARNAGSATAGNIDPTFNLFIGEEQVATIALEESFPANLSAGETSDVITVPLLNEPVIPLTLNQLIRLQQGAPITIRLIGLDADVVRWRPEDSSWSCDPCTWENFQDQIEARTLRLMVDFGYSGDPNAEVPRELTGTPFEYRVFAGSRSGGTSVSLEQALRLIGYTVDTSGSETIIQGRPYSQWYFASGPETGGVTRDSTFLDYWDLAGNPVDLLGLAIPAGTALTMASPDPLDPGPVVTSTLLDRSMRGVEVVASPKGSIPVAGGDAYLFSADGRSRVVALTRVGSSDVFSVDSVAYPVAVDSSYVIMRDVIGNERRIDSLAITVPVQADCANYRTDLLRAPTFVAGRGLFTRFVDGDPLKPTTAYCLSTENGAFDVWYPQTNDMGGGDVLGIDVIDETRRVAVGEGAILYSEDGGLSWNRVALDTDVQNTTFHAVSFKKNTNTGVTVGDNGVVMRSTDGGITWSRVTVNSASATGYRAVDHAGNNIWYAVGGADVLRSTDDGVNWEPIDVVGCDENGQNCVNIVQGFANLTAVSFISETTGAIGDNRMADGLGRVYTTLDGGATWIEEPLITSVNDTVNDIDHDGENTWYVVTFDKVIRIDMDGAREDAIVYQTANLIEVTGVSFVTPEIGFAMHIGGPVHRTGDGGATWAAPFGGYPTPSHPGAAFMTDIDMLDANVGAVTGTAGVIGATDSGGGVLVTDPASLVRTSIEEEVVAEVPQSIELQQNYPNPFNPTTRIAFHLDESQQVRLDVYDVLGRRVATLVDEFKTAGTYTVTFNADGLASGMYLYRLQSDTMQRTRRMMLLQ